MARKGNFVNLIYLIYMVTQHIIFQRNFAMTKKIDAEEGEAKFTIACSKTLLIHKVMRGKYNFLHMPAYL